jgi:hypothetical protein
LVTVMMMTTTTTTMMMMMIIMTITMAELKWVWLRNTCTDVTCTVLTQAAQNGSA